jgi:hypothetical protein
MLKATFVRTVGDRDRIYVTRSDGSEVSWIFPTYGDVPPHDMIHLIVESAFAVTQGFWGRVDAGVDPGVIAEQANRIGGRNKYAAFGADLSSLVLAEILANIGWLMEGNSAEVLQNQILMACREASVEAPVPLSAERTAQVRNVLHHLVGKWRRLKPKGAIQLSFDPLNPDRSFDQLLKDEAVQQATGSDAATSR